MSASMRTKSRRVPLELRRRTEHSCDRCKTRKQKCVMTPGDERCRHCSKYGYECAVTKPRKQRQHRSVYNGDTRTVVMESLIKGLIPEIDTSNLENMQEMSRSLGIPLPDIAFDQQDATQEEGNESQEVEHLVQDLQGQDQYIGRSSSYLFQMKLRALIGNRRDPAIGPMYMFGPNPASSVHNRGRSPSSPGQADAIDLHSIASATSPRSTGGLPSGEMAQPDPSAILPLVQIFFERVNVDFPVLHEASFLEKLDTWLATPSASDPTWLCAFLCVLILARRLSDSSIPDNQEERLWAQIQSLLSKVMFTSTLGTVQSLMLASLHLHNTNSRDICWTLTGAAIRIGFAIGLHRSDVDLKATPLTREMRKRVWWTLYSFEQLQVSSHDRPTALDNSRHLCGSPRETILDMGSLNPPEYATWSNRLALMLGAACKLPRTAARSDYSGPLSPAAGLLRELSKWRATLPRHLTVDLVDAMPPSFRRPLILLHIQYHYVVSLIARYALLSRFNVVSNDKAENLPESVMSISDVCINSARSACQLLLTLDSMAIFNSVTWWDTYYLYSSTLVLVLSIMCRIGERKGAAATDSRRLLRECTDLASRHLGNPRTPGTMRRWLVVVTELNSMVADFAKSQAGGRSPSPQTSLADPDIGGINIEQCSLVPVVSITSAFAVTSTGSSQKTLAAVAPETPPLFDPLPLSFETDILDQRADMESRYDLLAAGDFFGSSSCHEMHWEDISDMLLGSDTRGWNVP